MTWASGGSPRRAAYDVVKVHFERARTPRPTGGPRLSHARPNPTGDTSDLPLPAAAAHTPVRTVLQAVSAGPCQTSQAPAKCEGLSLVLAARMPCTEANRTERRLICPRPE